MANLDDARATQLANIEKRTGKTLAELSKIVANSGLSKHGERVAMLKSTLNMGHGDANALVHYAAKSDVPNKGPPRLLRPPHRSKCLMRFTLGQKLRCVRFTTS